MSDGGVEKIPLPNVLEISGLGYPWMMQTMLPIDVLL